MPACVCCFYYMDLVYVFSSVSMVSICIHSWTHLFVCKYDRNTKHKYTLVLLALFSVCMRFVFRVCCERIMRHREREHKECIHAYPDEYTYAYIDAYNIYIYIYIYAWRYRNILIHTYPQTIIHTLMHLYTHTTADSSDSEFQDRRLRIQKQLSFSKQLSYKYVCI